MALQFKLPDIGEGVAEGEIVQWLVQPGDAIKEDQALVEIMTDKVTAEIPSPASGTIAELHGKPGEVIAVGTVIAVIETGKTSPSKEKPEEKTASTSQSEKTSQLPSQPASGNSVTEKQAIAPSSAQAATASHVLAAPATRKLARTLGLDLTHIQGTGPNGRITQADVQHAKAGGQHSVDRLVSVAVPADTRQPFTGIRKKIAERLSLSKQKAPHFAYVEEVDVTDLVSLRCQLKPEAEARGAKLTYLPFVMLAVSRALTEFPVLNSTLDEDAGEVIYKGAHNLGMAVDTPNGLVVPVIPKIQGQNLLALAQQVARLAEKARAGQLSTADVTGGTFTLTSIGSIGGLFGVPIINYPEVAILGINTITPRPVVRDGQIVVRDILYLSLSCDHRVVDGADAARFMNMVKALLEAPARLLLS